MLLKDKIISSEEKYKLILEEFFIKIFPETYLPSHGIEHHRRVWYNAKDLLNQLHNNGSGFDQTFTDRLIIACYLHDIGLSADKGSRHGIESRKICEKFLSENNLPEIEFEEVLHSIEYHDNKEYTIISWPEELSTILSVADDLDAFGFIGIYRYLEIYTERGKPLKEIGFLINENCANRYRNFINTYRFPGDFIERHSKRYEILTSFFDSYNEQASYYKFDSQIINGYCGIAEIVSGISGKNKSDSIFTSASVNIPDPVIQWFSAQLKSELEFFNKI
jgi:HD superfamily phosphodiesterase